MEYERWTSEQRTETVSVDEHDLEVAYYDEGNGEPIVFCHGIPTSSFLWREIAPPLADDYRVIVPDMVGYGNSAMHDGFDRSIRAQEEMIDGLLDELGVDPVTFVGHDLGGGVGLRYAVHEPEAVDRLVLSNAVSYDSWPIETIVDLGIPSTIDEMSVDDVQEMVEKIFRSTLAGDPDEAFLEGMLAPWNTEEGIVSLSRNAIATNTSHTTEIDPGEVTAQTLLLWGGDDEFQPMEYAERLESDVSDAELVGLDGANHWVMVDQPEAYLDRLHSFLEGA
ncbi:alpha/beta fold hydrolase [Natronosalvus rutilus]|uniref:Alpha/beta hydrolase n=1 Tax=Natronosalvus rutilus TaxID=2953753 RepID=A0A9E7SUC6_9EURY|nr:alpha/beta hydrolase [Natronosalvus rutilus]UTF53350.1 alpha/beta hydrolase [Natronosalvus rutilus]